MRYCQSTYFFERRKTRKWSVAIRPKGGVIIAAISDRDAVDVDLRHDGHAASVQQTLELVNVGCQLVRITAPTVKTPRIFRTSWPNCARAAALSRSWPISISSPTLRWKRQMGREGPHQSATMPTRRSSPSRNIPTSNMPPNWRASRAFHALVKICKERGRAMRIGTNHGSLSDRIMNRFGDTPLGMVESALEFARTRPQARLSQLRLLDEVEQSQGHDRMLSAARGTIGRTWTGLELSDSPWCDRSGRRRRWPDQERHRHRAPSLRWLGRYDPRFR